jgi:hypothetical protein
MQKMNKLEAVSRIFLGGGWVGEWVKAIPRIAYGNKNYFSYYFYNFAIFII